MTNDIGDQATQGKLWEFIPLSDYVTPDLPVQGALKRRWLRYQQVFKKPANKSQLFEPKSALKIFDEEDLSRFLKNVDWQAPAAALSHILQKWLDDAKPNNFVQFIVGPPHANLAEIVEFWAENFGFQRVLCPKEDEILRGGKRWLEQLSEVPNLWVLLHLEHCFLRHAEGLHLVRQFLASALTGNFGKGVVVCDSWAWAYLQRVWAIPEGEVLTLRAFEGPHLAEFLTSLTLVTTAETIYYRHAVRGTNILQIPKLDESTHTEIMQLAAYSRGNFGVALHEWRARLRHEPEENQKVKPYNMSELVIWVADEVIDLTTMLENKDDILLVLHALLLHGGLSENALAHVLPFSPSECALVLNPLWNGKWIKKGADRWYVSELRYIAIRQLLKERDYLVDRF